MNEKLKKMLAALEKRKADMVAKSEKTEDVKELRAINSQMVDINEEIRSIKEMLVEIENEENGDPAAEERGTDEKGNEKGVEKRKIIGTYTGSEEEKRNKDVIKIYEQRGVALKDGKPIRISFAENQEERAVTVGSSNLVVQKKYSNKINDTFNEVSGLIDTVNAIPLNGGESYDSAFVKSYGEGDYTDEGAEYHETDPVTDFVSITKTKITAYTEMTEEAKKLPNLDYQALVAKNIRTAIRKKITRQIVAGAGTAGTITGIFNAPTNVIPTETDIEIVEIDENTLDNIVFGYGGDEDVEGGAELILNKKDLEAFAKVRLSDGKKAYKIELNRDGNQGTISAEGGSYKIPYIINSVCPILSADATVADTYCMAYGKPMAYEMPVFSDVEILESRDYKFKEGQIAFKGSVFVGGNVSSYKGYVRIKKVAAV